MNGEFDDNPGGPAESFVSGRFSESYNLGDGYWLHKINGVNFPDFPWLVNRGVYPSGQLIHVCLTKWGARFCAWNDKRKAKNRRKWFRGWTR